MLFLQYFFLAFLECYAQFYGLDIRNLFCSGVIESVKATTVRVLKFCVIDLLEVHEVMTGRRVVMSFNEVSFISTPKTSIWNWKNKATGWYFNHNAVRLQFERETSPRSQHVFLDCYTMYSTFKQTLGEGASTIVQSRRLWIGFYKTWLDLFINNLAVFIEVS